MAYALSLAARGDLAAALLARISAGESATLELYTSADVLLASIDLDVAGADIDETTADLTIPIAAREDSAPAEGSAAYALVRNGAAAAVVELPCKEGATADPGWCVMTRLSIAAGQPVEAAPLVFVAGALIGA
jgi:hypothetical protein